MTNTTAYLSAVEITPGVEKFSQLMKGMDPWTVTLTTEHGSESFPFYVGKGHNGAEPEVADLIHCMVADASCLECEPEMCSKETAAVIRENSRKMARLFGCYWETLQAMDEEEIFAAF